MAKSIHVTATRLSATSECSSSYKFFHVGGIKIHSNSILPQLSQNLFSIQTLIVSGYWKSTLIAPIHQLRKEMYVQLEIISILMVLNLCQQMMTPSDITQMLNRDSKRVEHQGNPQRKVLSPSTNTNCNWLWRTDENLRNMVFPLSTQPPSQPRKIP